MVKKLVWNTSAQIAGRFVSAISTLGITILIASRFGTIGYGDFVKITTFVGFFYLLADFGFNAIFLQRDDTHWYELLGLRILVSSLLVFVALIVLACIPQGAIEGYTHLVRVGIVLFVPTIVFQALTTTANALFQKYLRYDIAAVAVVIGSAVSLALVWTVVQGTPPSGVLLAVAALLVGSAATAIASLWSARKFAGKIHVSLSFLRLRSLFLASFPLGLTLIFNLVYFHIDSVILTLTRTTAEVGIYGLAYKVFELPLVIPTFFMNALYPVMLRTQNKEFISLIKRSAIFLLLISFILALCVWFAAPLISYIKQDFLPGVPALQVLSLGLPFFFLSSLTMWTLITTRRQVTLMYIYGISMILNIVLNILFVPSYGYMAAAWITVASEAFVFLLSGVVVYRILHRTS